ncbi:hypothetical protein ONZ45_g2367 [Pleurotus djamor]|nr:hypothetical protein ONZ45_g2367 [Pleurotus djamor]
MSILDLPLEILEDIVSLCDPCDVAAASQTCRVIWDLVYSQKNNYLWRTLYLAIPLDDPRSCVDQLGNLRTEEEVDWKGRLQAVIRARNVLNDPGLLRPGELVVILRTLLELVTLVPPMSLYSLENDISLNLIWTAAYLRKREGEFLDCPLRPHLDEESEEVQLKNRLHAYFGMTHEDVKTSARAASRGYVYTMSRYTAANLYGPYMPDGSLRINWVHVQAIHHVVSAHIVELEEDTDFEYAVFPLSMSHIQPVLPNGSLQSPQDWAGVEGEWHIEAGPLDPSYFESPMSREVFRSMKVKMSVTEMRPGVGHLPVIHFRGSMGNPSSALMTGWVEMTEHDYIRWHFVSGEPGNSIWSSEGIQVGSVCSMYGVLGTWSTTFHDVDDPIGPFWLRKLLD